MTIFQDSPPYYNEKGEIIVERRVIEGQEPEGFVRFGAPVRVAVARDPAGNVAFAEGMAEIDAIDVIEAFEKRGEAVEAASKVIRAEALRKMSTPKLVIAK
ncbi:MAG TPA: hypothetical protein VGA18_05180 [Rhodothermales bacterium]